MPAPALVPSPLTTVSQAGSKAAKPRRRPERRGGGRPSQPRPPRLRLDASCAGMPLTAAEFDAVRWEDVDPLYR